MDEVDRDLLLAEARYWCALNHAELLLLRKEYERLLVRVRGLDGL